MKKVLPIIFAYLFARCEFKFLGGLSVVVDVVYVPEQLMDGAL